MPMTKAITNTSHYLYAFILVIYNGKQTMKKILVRIIKTITLNVSTGTEMSTYLSQVWKLLTNYVRGGYKRCQKPHLWKPKQFCL